MGAQRVILWAYREVLATRSTQGGYAIPKEPVNADRVDFRPHFATYGINPWRDVRGPRSGERKMSERVFRCYAYGSPGNWQGICVDLDIAVQGSTFQQVLEFMGEAIESYVDDALAEGPVNAERLLARRAPWHVRAKLAFSSAIHILRMDRDDDQLTANFDVPCHA